MKDYFNIFTPVVLALILGSLTLAFAQTESNDFAKPAQFAKQGFGAPPGFPPHGSGFDPRTLEQIGLSDDQKQQIKTLMDTARSDSRQYFDALRTADEQLRTMTESGSFNEGQAREILANKAKAQTEMEIIRLKTETAVSNLLTAEQKAQLKQLKTQDFQRRPPMDMPPPRN